MSSFLDTAELGYKNACLRCIDEQVKFTNSHVLYRDEGIVKIRVEDSKEIFSSFSEIIHWAVEIYDRLDQSLIDEEDRKVMSGIKHIDNILKHTEQNFEIEAFLRMYAKHEIRGKKNGEAVNINYRIIPAFQFQDIAYIPCSSKWANQRQAYNDKIKGKDMNDVISNVDKVLVKHFIGIREKGGTVKYK